MCPDSPRFFRRATKEARAIGRVEKFSMCPKSQRNGRHMTKKASAVGSAPKIPTQVSSEYPTSWVTFRILHQNSSRKLRHPPRCTLSADERFPDFLDFWVFFAIFSQGERTRRLRFFGNRRWNQQRVRCGVRQNLKMSKKSGDLRHHLLGRYWRPYFFHVFFVFTRAYTRWSRRKPSQVQRSWKIREIRNCAKDTMPVSNSAEKWGFGSPHNLIKFDKIWQNLITFDNIW